MKKAGKFGTKVQGKRPGTQAGARGGVKTPKGAAAAKGLGKASAMSPRSAKVKSDGGKC